MSTPQVVKGASDALRRSARGLFQLGFAEAIIRLLEAFSFVTWNEDQHIAVLAVLTPIVTAVQNYLEDNKGLPAILKAPASSGQDPLPDPGAENGEADIMRILAIVVALLAIFLVKAVF